MNSLSFMCQ